MRRITSDLAGTDADSVTVLLSSLVGDALADLGVLFAVPLLAVTRSSVRGHMLMDFLSGLVEDALADLGVETSPEGPEQHLPDL